MVDFSRKGSTAILTLNHPPVNSLSQPVLHALRTAIQRVRGDATVQAVVIAGNGRAFSAGADINAFKSLPDRVNPVSLSDLISEIEAVDKPVVGAIHGFCLGGGLEVALGCHYRVAQPSTKFGFPEVSIGLLPGAQGTQRLPRLCGMKTALEVITSGRHLSAQQAQSMGIVDQITSSNVVEAAIKLAKSKTSSDLKSRRISKMSVPGDKQQATRDVQDMISKLKQKNPHLMAPVYNALAVGAAAELPFDEGLRREKELFSTLVTSSQALAQQYLFMAERLATKWIIPGSGRVLDPSKALPVRSAAVIGAGTMGTGITVTLLNAGIPVKLLEQNEKFLRRGVEMIKGIYAGSVQRGKLTAEQAKSIASQLTPVLDYDSLANVDLVIEAVFENLEIKKDVFRKLEKVCKPNAILASNTSTLSIDKIASAVSRPERVVGMHYFAPAFIMRLLEVVRGSMSSDAAVATACQIGKLTKKVTVLVGNCDGFVANRMRKGSSIENSLMLEEGATPQDVDKVMEDMGFPMGPFKVGDLSGLDVGHKIFLERLKAAGVVPDGGARYFKGEKISHISAELVAAGRHGRKTGMGYYRYDKPGGKTAMPDPFVTRIIEQCAARFGVERRTVSPQEIFERSILPQINESFRCLEEGIATRPEDIDVINAYGFSWPRQSGGPMYLAQQMGLKHIVDRLDYYWQIHPTSAHFQPCNMLKRLAQQNPQPPMKEWMKFASPHLFSNL